MIDVNTTEDEQTDEEKEASHTNNLLAYGDLFHQLMQFERFQRFVACNYEINVVQDDDKKEVRTVAIEVPDEDVQKKLMELFKAPEGEVDIKVPTAKEIAQLSK